MIQAKNLKQLMKAASVKKAKKMLNQVQKMKIRLLKKLSVTLTKKSLGCLQVLSRT